MADNKTPSDNKPARPNEFPVKLLRFMNGAMIEFAKFRGDSALKSTPEPSKQERYVIAYVPQMRHHRVDYYAPGAGDTVTSTHWIYEGHVGSWEAA